MKSKSDYARSNYERVYDIKFKDGTTKLIIGYDIPVKSAGRIYSVTNQNLLSDRFLAIRTIDGKENILIAIDSIKCINISEYQFPGIE